VADPLAADDDLPAVAVVDAHQDVHQRRLAGAVLADEGVNLAREDIEVDAVEGEHAGECLDDATHRNDGRHLH
jgi:hypothetical protein